MKLPFVEFGQELQNANPRPIVLVHGLFGQGKNFAGIARSLATKRHVLTLDLRNHGDADWNNLHDYPSLAEDILETLDHFKEVDLLGHSMGGKAAMMAALIAPSKIRRLISADIAPISYQHSHTGLIDAMMSIDLTNVHSRRDADLLLKSKIPEDGIRAFLLHSLDIHSTPPRWKNNLSVLRAAMTEIVAWPSVSCVFNGPTLFLGGKNSNYIAANGHHAIKHYFPQSKILHIKDAGHWLHADQPKIFTEIVDDFFND